LAGGSLAQQRWRSGRGFGKLEVEVVVGAGRLPQDGDPLAADSVARWRGIAGIGKCQPLPTSACRAPCANWRLLGHDAVRGRQRHERITYLVRFRDRRTLMMGFDWTHFSIEPPKSRAFRSGSLLPLPRRLQSPFSSRAYRVRPFSTPIVLIRRRVHWRKRSPHVVGQFSTEGCAPRVLVRPPTMKPSCCRLPMPSLLEVG